MQKGEISNKLAFGVGVDHRILFDQVPAARWVDRVRGRHDFKLNVRGGVLIDRLFKQGYRLYVYAVNVEDYEWLRLNELCESLPIQRRVRAPDYTLLGQQHLGDVDVFFTDDPDFYDVYRLSKNVRYFDTYTDIYNYLRYFGE